jgi:hypothetical protein
MSKNPEFIKAAEERALTLDIKWGDDYGKDLIEQEEAFTAIWNEVKDQYK